MLTDYDTALQVLRQYNAEIPISTVAGVDFSLVHNDDATDIIFEGTHDTKDRIRDLKALMVPVSFGRVHGGAWEGIIAAIDTIVPRLPDIGLIRFSGHSLGSMRASLAACELQRRGYKNIECVTFGAPLCMDQDAATYFNLIKNRTYQNYLDMFHHDFFTTVPLCLPEEPYVIPPNRIRFWSAPTDTNEFKGEGELIECHSMGDCYIPGMKGLQNGQAA